MDSSSSQKSGYQHVAHSISSGKTASVYTSNNSHGHGNNNNIYDSSRSHGTGQYPTAVSQKLNNNSNNNNNRLNGNSSNYHATTALHRNKQKQYNTNTGNENNNNNNNNSNNNSLVMTPKQGQSGKLNELSRQGIVFVTWCIIGTEFCERLAFYGINGNLELFLKKEFNLTTALASTHVALWTGACYLTTLLGGWLADAYLNRYFAILLFAFIYLIGLVGVSFVSWKTAIKKDEEALEWIFKLIFWISLYLVAFGTGGIKPNVSTLGAEQFDDDDDDDEDENDKDGEDESNDNEDSNDESDDDNATNGNGVSQREKQMKIGDESSGDDNENDNEDNDMNRKDIALGTKISNVTNNSSNSGNSSNSSNSLSSSHRPVSAKYSPKIIRGDSPSGARHSRGISVLTEPNFDRSISQSMDNIDNLAATTPLDMTAIIEEQRDGRTLTESQIEPVPSDNPNSVTPSLDTPTATQQQQQTQNTRFNFDANENNKGENDKQGGNTNDKIRISKEMSKNGSTIEISNKKNVIHVSKSRQQKESFFNWFYFSINCGSLLSFTVVAYLCQEVNFGIGYSVTTVALAIGIVFFAAASHYYRVLPATGSIISLFLFVIVEAISRRSYLKKLRLRMKHQQQQQQQQQGTQSSKIENNIHWLDVAKSEYGGKFSSFDVESVKAVLNVGIFVLYFMVYWLVYFQMSTLFVAQGCQMNLSFFGYFDIPIAMLQLFDAVPILILVPLLDRLILPALRNRGFRITMLQRMGTGFMFASLTMITAGGLEYIRKREDIMINTKSTCDNDGSIPVTNLSIFWQIPQFILIGVSEVLASITGLEFFFSQSPKHMRSLLMAIFLVTNAVGSYMVSVLISIVNYDKNNEWITDNLNDGHLEYYFFVIALAMFIVLIFFIFSAKKYEYRDLTMMDKLRRKESQLKVYSKKKIGRKHDKTVRTTPTTTLLDNIQKKKMKGGSPNKNGQTVKLLAENGSNIYQTPDQSTRAQAQTFGHHN